ncbi:MULTISPECIES: hypothetical protein [Bacillaceae]|uniref:hypothetical protein n=1 Tax=Bacillaceae TaxID=186817 RepID=UPI000C76765B|nr:MULTISPECIES: hypothetical protein [Bacillaceae]PLR66098.1 hypothetical protein CYJ36_20790 [Bacillus sp. UMB0893]QNG60677.1 hypothetical protein H4O14_03935 [Bacillus sp. PAMC26568]
MRNRFMLILLLTLCLLTAAFFIPKQMGDGAQAIPNEKMQQEADLAIDTIQALHFNSFQRALSLNEHVLSVKELEDSNQKCYETTVQFYTFFGLPLSKVKADCNQIADIK